MAFTAKSDANLRFFFGLAKTLREFFYNYELGIAFGEPATPWIWLSMLNVGGQVGKGLGWRDRIAPQRTK